MSLENNYNIFEVAPSRATGSAQVRLSVRDVCLIDYDPPEDDFPEDMIPRKYDLKVMMTFM